MSEPQWEVIEGDCLEVMRGMDAGSVDCVVTDPPYGIGWERGTWDDDPQAYPAFMREVIAEMNRVVDGGPVFMWQAMPNCTRWHEWLPDEYRIFAACKGFVQYRPTPMQWSWDPVIVWGKMAGEPSVYRKDYHVQSLAPFGAGRVKIEHPSPKPLEQTAYVVEMASLPGQIVLDCFCGSGTTGLAAVQLERRFVGIEQSPVYADMARKRIANWRHKPVRAPKQAGDERQVALFVEGDAA